MSDASRARPFFETNLTAERAAAATASGEWNDRSLWSYARHWATELASERVVVDRFGAFTWGELGEQVEAASAGLLELGMRPGEVVQIQLPNWRHFIVAALAAERIGVVVNPVAPIFRHHEVSVMSELAQPTVVLTTTDYRGFGLAAMHAELRSQCPWVRDVVVVEPPVEPPGVAGDESGVANIGADAVHFDEFLEMGRLSAYDAAAVALLEPDPDAVVELIFTSGTTGTPKGVMHTPNTLNAGVLRVSEVLFDGLTSHLGARAPDAFVTHMASTMGHQTGYLYGARHPLMSGGCVVLQDVWDPAEFVELIATHRIVHSIGATPFLADVLGVDGLGDADLSSWRRFICAGATIPKPMLERAAAELPCVVMPAWGMTETAAMTMGRPDDSIERRMTDGRPTAGQHVRVVDERGAAVVGEEGDLEARGSLLFVGYVQGRAFTAQHFTPVDETGGAGDEPRGVGDEPHTGWFATGDRAVLDAQGYITITGRSKDIVIRGGENVPVKEVEDVLVAHPDVDVAAVVGKPHERLGEVACAFVQPSAARKTNELTLAELTDWLATHNVTKQFWPEELVLVSEFPMTPSGKVQKFKLRQQLNG